MVSAYADLGFEYTPSAAVYQPRAKQASTSEQCETGVHKNTCKKSEGAQWQCISPDQWSCFSKGARALRSPSAVGIKWHEVYKRVTTDLHSLEVVDVTCPRRDCITEAEACKRIM